MKILADESVDFPLVIALLSLGYDIVYISESYPGISDELVLIKANSDNRILLTADKDFGELVYRLRKIHSGVILYRLNGWNIEQKTSLIVKVFSDHFHEFSGKFSVITKIHIRIRSFQGI